MIGSSSSSSSLSSLTQQELSWKHVFPPLQYVSPWDDDVASSSTSSSTSLRLQKSSLWQDTALDVNSRQVIACLQELYRTGKNNNNNENHDGGGGGSVVTLEGCHYVLQQLGSTSSHNNSNSNKGLVTAERTQRAETLVETMQLLEASAPSQTMMPFALPTPNGRTYRLLLDIYARTEVSSKSADNTNDGDDSLSVAQRARQLVLRLQDDYRHGADLDRKPTVVDWNMVLQAYANAPHPDRATHAVNDVFLPHMLESDNNVTTMDASSLLFVMRACGFRVPTNEARRTGALLAAQIWERLFIDSTSTSTDTGRDKQQQQQQEMMKRLIPTLMPQFYSLFLQTIRHLPPSDQRQRLFEEAFCMARDQGKLNHVIVKEFIMHAKPWSLVERVVGTNRLQAVKGLEPSQAARQLVANMPTEWTNEQQSPR